MLYIFDLFNSLSFFTITRVMIYFCLSLFLVSGVAMGGEMLAVLGSSGSGKTTLLNALAFRSPPGVRVSPAAVRALNGIPVDAAELRARCAYVQQDDLFIGSLTPKEHLIFQVGVRSQNILYIATLQMEQIF